MSAQTKIVVLRMKTVIYTVILAVLAIFLIVMLILMFASKSDSTAQSNSKQDNQNTSSIFTQSSNSIYTPGRYSACLMLSGSPVELIVTVDNDHINGINFCQLSETVTTSYPLIEPALESLTEQIIDTQSVENLNVQDSMKYTQNALIDTIKTALHKASI